MGLSALSRALSDTFWSALTPRPSPEVVQRLHDAGRRCGASLPGPDAALGGAYHDRETGLALRFATEARRGVLLAVEALLLQQDRHEGYRCLHPREAKGYSTRLKQFDVDDCQRGLLLRGPRGA